MIRQLDERTLVSGQIGPDDVARLKDQGVTMIVCNRPDGEEVGQPRAADIEQAANEAGIEFRFVPIIRGIGPSDAEAVQDALESATGKVLLYCRSGNRSSLAWAVARRGQGASVEDVSRAVTQAGHDIGPVEHLL